MSGSKKAKEFHLDRGWNHATPWYEPEATAEIHISRDKLIEKFAELYPQYESKITNSPEEIYNGKPLMVYGNAIDAAMASGYYMRSKTSPKDEEWGTLVYPWTDGSGFVFVEPNSTKENGHSAPWNSRKEWDKIDPNTRWDEVARSHTHGLRNTTEGSMHFSPEDYEHVESGKMEYMVNSRGEHRFLFPGGGDDHVYVIKKLAPP
jgi:hypothetical protein